MTGPSARWLLVVLIVTSNVRADSRIIGLTLYRDKSPRGVPNITQSLAPRFLKELPIPRQLVMVW